MADRFYIGMVDNNASLQTSLKPFAIPDNAFARLNNAFVFRGRIKKRFGSRLMRGTTTPITGLEQIQSRFKVKIGPLISGNTYNINTILGTSTNMAAIGQAFSVGGLFFTAYQTTGSMLKRGVGILAGTYDTTTGNFVFTGLIAGDIYFFPSLPVMGLIKYQQPAVDIEECIGFDTKFAYTFAANGWERLGTAVWTGDNSQFFWGYTSRGTSAADYYLYVTNYNFGTNLSNSDPMYYYNGSWNSFTPGFTNGTATNTVLTARIIVSFKGRLLLLNVVENTGAGPGTNTTYTNRVRWSWVGDPTNAAAFYDNVAGSGGFLDASTKEAIVTAQFIKDRLIVYFEASTWELAYTGNQVAPFIWQKINTELGAESTFSQVPFDKVVIGVGNVGVHACNGSNVERIDTKIPDEVFDIHVDYTSTNDGIARIYGIRDFYEESVYWTFPDEEQTAANPFNNKIFVYNYRTGSWAFNDDSITAFGYYTLAQNSAATALQWQQASQEWQEANFTWRSPTELATFTSILAGNQEGFTFIIDNDLSSNAPVLQITNISLPAVQYLEIDCINHNMRVDQYVKITNVTDPIIITDVNDNVTNLNDGIYQVAVITNVNSFYIDIGVGSVASISSGAYSGDGLLARVTPIDILTKQYNFYAEDGRNALISKVDCLVTATGLDPFTNLGGQCMVDFLVSSSDTGIINQLANPTVLPGTSILETTPYTLIPYEAQQERLWHPVYLWADGEYIQLRFYLNQAQSTTQEIAEANFELHAMTFYATPTSSRLQ